jgi:hypothetical protein
MRTIMKVIAAGVLAFAYTAGNPRDVKALGCYNCVPYNTCCDWAVDDFGLYCIAYCDMDYCTTATGGGWAGCYDGGGSCVCSPWFCE